VSLLQRLHRLGVGFCHARRQYTRYTANCKRREMGGTAL
jgi:hypothetical protein